MLNTKTHSLTLVRAQSWCMPEFKLCGTVCTVEWLVLKFVQYYINMHKVANEHVPIFLVTATLISKLCWYLTATLQEKAGDDHAVCQITSERFQKSLQRHLSLYVTTHTASVFVFSVVLVALARSFKYVSTLTWLNRCCSLFSVCLSLCNCSHLFCHPLSLPVDDATRVILKSTDDYINANYINVSLCLLIWLVLCFHPCFALLRRSGWSAFANHQNTCWDSVAVMLVNGFTTFYKQVTLQARVFEPARHLSSYIRNSLWIFRGWAFCFFTKYVTTVKIHCKCHFRLRSTALLEDNYTFLKCSCMLHPIVQLKCNNCVTTHCIFHMWCYKVTFLSQSLFLTL